MISATCSAALMAYWLCSATVTSVESGQLRPNIGWCTREMADLLDELDRLDADTPAGNLTAALTAHLPEATRTCFDALANNAENHGGTRATAQRAVLLNVLGHAPQRLLMDLVQEALYSPSEPHRSAALVVLGELGHAAELPMLFKAVDRGDDIPSDHVLQAFEDSLGQVLERDSRAFAGCRSLWSGSSEPVIEHVVGALGTTGGDASIELLLQILNRRVIPDATVLGRIARLAESASPEQAAELRATLVDYLDGDEPMTCQIAAQALGRLAAAEAVPTLIELLEAEHRGVRDSALWALRRISLRSFRDDAARWERWYENELAWFDEKALEREEQLYAENIATVGAALRDLASHPLFAHELVPVVEQALEHEDPGVRICAIRTLARFTPLVSGPALQYALDDWDENVAAAAQEALDQQQG